MTDPTDPIRSYEAAQADFERRFSISLVATKTTIFDVLASAQIAMVAVGFDGSGDSGQIDEPTAYGADDSKLPLPAVDVIVTIEEFGREAAPGPRVLNDAIRDLASSLLERQHGGWEDNEGGFGEILFDTAERSITIEFNERFVDTKRVEHRF